MEQEQHMSNSSKGTCTNLSKSSLRYNDTTLNNPRNNKPNEDKTHHALPTACDVETHEAKVTVLAKMITAKKAQESINQVKVSRAQFSGPIRNSNV
jgi:hypothetical protein